ncbi:uncharacterized protein FOMMEDRAFT_162611 [Fomitiporia mediterranea MF3/22]|uniref:Uncharacterized protein n=1 Tax=Fomitiporia mediterranea (strain MF3/22) TaxID=694068 RepID=R7SHC0_FOMME|nr:uncharacterized protein FOMMEDRAFT_162611 [Fomitiporia mediterranea MF3/22]EJC97790.1 hypothetical protein FOMMEDRAFT_162611 [Fomitiporia mediterranea MF3/22]
MTDLSVIGAYYSQLKNMDVDRIVHHSSLLLSSNSRLHDYASVRPDGEKRLSSSSSVKLWRLKVPKAHRHVPLSPFLEFVKQYLTQILYLSEESQLRQRCAGSLITPTTYQLTDLIHCLNVTTLQPATDPRLKNSEISSNMEEPSSSSAMRLSVSFLVWSEVVHAQGAKLWRFSNDSGVSSHQSRINMVLVLVL